MIEYFQYSIVNSGLSRLGKIVYSIFVQCSTHLRESLGLKPETEKLMQNQKAFENTQPWLAIDTPPTELSGARFIDPLCLI
jgi:hypothetical protein